MGELLLSLSIVDRGNKLDPFYQRQVGPVDAISIVAVVWMCQVVEDLALLLGCDGAIFGKLYGLIAGLRAMGHGYYTDGGVVMLVVLEVVRHIGDKGRAPQVALDLAGRTPFATGVACAGRRRGVGEKGLGGKTLSYLLVVVDVWRGGGMGREKPRRVWTLH